MVTAREVEGIGMRPGYLHPGCAAGYLEREPADLLAAVEPNSPQLGEEDLAALRSTLG